MLLRDKAIIVTGAGRGIGRDIAIQAALAGAAVVVNDYDAKGADDAPAREVVARIKEAGGRAIANFGDVSLSEDAQGMVAEAIDVFGRLDGVVNNAGIVRDRIFHRMSYDEWRQVIDVNLTGPFNVSRAAAEVFKKQQSGAYVHLTSTSGLIGNFGQANYSASKLGLVALSKSIALDMKAFGVRSNCIAPFAWTRMTDTIPADTPEQAVRLERARKMTPEQIAPLALFLLSDMASDVSGQVLASRMNEIMLFNNMRPVRSIHRSEGWTATTIADTVLPAMRPHFSPLDRSPEYFSWDPI